MSIRKNTLDLDSHYDLTKSGQNDYVGFYLHCFMGFWCLWTTRTKYYNKFSSPVQIPGTSWSSISAGNESFISNQD
jgi:hypothetical protein